MYLVTDNKCTCANCNAVIDYYTSQVGQIVECPACGEKSRLPAPIQLIVLHPEGPPVPEFRNCEICGSQMQFWSRHCALCEAARRRRRRNIQILIGSAAIVILALAGLAVQRFAKPEPVQAVALPPAKPLDLTIHAATNIPTATGSHMLIEQPRPRLPKSTNDFRPGIFVLEKRRGSDLVMAVGDLQNDSEYTRTSIRIDLDLLDKFGKRIGTVSDYFTQLGPHQSGHFLATVNDPLALSVRLAYISEDK
ncbi:MAG TPA: FxLYD domain-containing protein [Verrucomicrobiae bacterium]|jgi:hypothetical protein|nr:FxLYD domain-containing protein [Verrucomicrobiae bacterium]